MALDRLVFLLEPKGVRIHWLTDEKYDFTAVPPDNAIDEPDSRRGPESLPLLPEEWNRVKLSVTGSTARLELNGALIYERELERTNQRTFGLFHYADRNEVLVRNPVMRGDWPKKLPPVFRQELADPALADADRNLEKLKIGFHHDFVRDGLPMLYFTYSGVNPAEAHEVVPGGVRDTEAFESVALIPRFSLQGDFDFQSQLDELDLAESGYEGDVMLELKLDDTRKHIVRMLRCRRDDLGEHLNAVISPLNPNGRRSYLGQREVDVASGGTLRIDRLGDRILFMFAEKNSRVFRTIREETISAAEVLMHGIQLKTTLNNGRRASVLWKNVTIRAEGMKYLAPANDAELKQLWIMNPDGTNLRKLTGLLQEMTSLGSVEFSHDGKQVALDMSQGSTTSSRVIVMNADGTGIRDLGSGCMPSFSPDGKRIAFTHASSGIMLMDADGTNREVVDPLGWAVQFSPDGTYLAYGKRGNITLLNLETKVSRELLTGDDAQRYAYTYWNLGWSNDSQSIAFKGRLGQTGGDEVVLVDIKDGALTVLDPDASRVNPDFTFSLDDQSVLFSVNAPDTSGPKLYLVNRKSPGKREFLNGQPEDRTLYNCDWSHDDRFITVTGKLEPEAVDWEPPKPSLTPPAVSP